MKPTTPLLAQNQKLRRELRACYQRRVDVLSDALVKADYDRWVAQTNSKIAAINARIRAVK